jgi:ABC-type phosphate/phosphonate transport system ATPase subunit
MIPLEKVEKSYPLEGDRSLLLRNVDLDLADSEFIRVIGPADSGKESGQ